MNVWFAPPATNSDTVFIFVHGYQSDSRAWLYDDGKNKQFWPYLIFSDSRFNHPDIFLGGYRQDVDSTFFELANQLRDALNRKGVLHYQRIVFVAHSLGGVIVRRMLTDFTPEFTDKQLFLFLFASPSNGSDIATFVDNNPFVKWLLDKLGQNSELIGALKLNSFYLRDLDSLFRLRTGSQNLLHVVGAEAIEADAVFATTKTVGTDSAGRYFEHKKIPGSDHTSIVKPRDEHSESHEFLAEMYQGLSAAITNKYSDTIKMLFARAKAEGLERTLPLSYYISTICGPGPVGSIAQGDREWLICNGEVAKAMRFYDLPPVK